MTATLCISSGKDVKFIFKVVRLLVTADCPPPFFLCLPSRVHPSKSNEITNDFLLRLSFHLSHLFLSLSFQVWHNQVDIRVKSSWTWKFNSFVLHNFSSHLSIEWWWWCEMRMNFCTHRCSPSRDWSFEHPGGLFMRTSGEFSEGYRVRCVCRRFVIYVETSRRRKRRGSKCRVSHCEDMFLIAQAVIEINQPEQRGFERM